MLSSAPASSSVGLATRLASGPRSVRSMVSVPAMKASGVVWLKASRMLASCAGASGRS